MSGAYEEMSEADSELVSWSTGNWTCEKNYLYCTCGHGSLGPDWHLNDCPTAFMAWRDLARRRHEEAHELLAEVRYLVGIVKQQAATLDSLLSGPPRQHCLVGELLGTTPCTQPRGN